MATHLQGVTDVIPSLIPWQPDFDFYRNALVQKEQQFDQGFQKVNSIYNSVFNSPLTHSENVERRDQAFKDIDQRLKKAAKLDLSKRENVESARKIFQPLLSDEYLQKDIAFTRSLQNGLRAADAYKNCVGENCEDKYWEEGVMELQMKAEEFAKSPLNKTLGFSNLQYTPYKNIYKAAQDAIKDMGFEVQNVSFTPDGRYKITTTNGEEMVADLEHFLINNFSNDPEAIAVHKTNAYIARKKFISENADLYGGEEQAEQEYFRGILTELTDQYQSQKNELEKLKEVYAGKVKITEEVAERPETALIQNDALMMQTLEKQGEAIQGSLDFVNRMQQLLDSKSLDPQNLDSFRQRIDGGIANQLLMKDLSSAAFDYAMLTKKVDVDEDKFALADYNHSLKIKEINYKNQLETGIDPNAPLPNLATTGVTVDGGTLQNSKININTEAASNFDAFSGRASSVAADQAASTFNKLYSQMMNTNDPQKRAFFENQIEQLFGIVDVTSLEQQQLDRSQRTLVMAEAWYEYLNSVPSSERDDLALLLGVEDLKDLSKENFIRAISDVSGQTSGIFNTGVKGVAKDMQDMVRGFERDGADWDSTWLMRGVYGKRSAKNLFANPGKENFAKISELYHGLLSKNTLSQGEGWVVRNPDGSLRFNKQAMAAADSLNITDDQGSPLNPYTIMERLDNFYNDPATRGLYESDLDYSLASSAFNDSYNAFNNAWEMREAIAEGQRNNNIEVVDYLKSGRAGQSDPQMWSIFGDAILTERGDIKSKEEIARTISEEYGDLLEEFYGTPGILDIENLADASTLGLITNIIKNKIVDNKASTVAKISGLDSGMALAEYLTDEFYKAFEEGLPGIESERLSYLYESTGAGSVFAQGKMFMYDGRHLTLEDENSSKRFNSFSHDELPIILQDGSTRIMKGDSSQLSDGDFDPDSDEYVFLKSAVQQLMQDVIGDRTPDLRSPAENRPKFTYTTFEIADGSTDRRAITITFDQQFAKNLKGVSKDGTSSAYNEVFGAGENSITITFTKPYGDALFVNSSTPDYAKKLNLLPNKNHVIYENKYSGRLEAKKNPGQGYVINMYPTTLYRDEKTGAVKIKQSNNPVTTTVTERGDISYQIESLRRKLEQNARDTQIRLNDLQNPRQDGEQ